MCVRVRLYACAWRDSHTAERATRPRYLHMLQERRESPAEHIYDPPNVKWPLTGREGCSLDWWYTINRWRKESSVCIAMLYDIEDYWWHMWAFAFQLCWILNVTLDDPSNINIVVRLHHGNILFNLKDRHKVPVWWLISKNTKRTFLEDFYNCAIQMMLGFVIDSVC